MIGRAHGAVLDGMDATVVLVEADVGRGLPQFSIVGLPDSAVSESKLRIRSAIRNSGLQFPAQRITVNLSPASMKKRGAGLDLAIAVAILRASNQIPAADLATTMPTAAHLAFAAELGLSGDLVIVQAPVNLAIALRRSGIAQVIVSQLQAPHCLEIPGLSWVGFSDLGQLVTALLHPDQRMPTIAARDSFLEPQLSVTTGWDEIRGLATVKRALTIAAVGRHHSLLVGPPGCGKTMISERFPALLPPLEEEEALEVYAVHQSAGLTTPPSRLPPMRSPHHSLTAAGLVGGGSPPTPGEVTLAHRGILLLDELPEFRRAVLDTLREPLEQRAVRLSRNGHAVTLPADFLLLATMNPCPCGQRGFGECRCSEVEARRYWNRLSGPLLDRIDLLIYVTPETWGRREAAADVAAAPISESSLKAQVQSARRRLQENAGRLGPLADSALDKSARQLLRTAATKLSISHRRMTSLRRVAASIAALAARDTVTEADVSEALALRLANRSSE